TEPPTPVVEPSPTAAPVSAASPASAAAARAAALNARLAAAVPAEGAAAAAACAALIPSILPSLPGRTDLSGSTLRPIVVQIDNAVPARPQLHLAEADAVYEYVAEGGVTRFSALFTKEDVGIVGPVRSARLISIEIARQFDALLLYHGASTGVQSHIWNGGIAFVSFGDPATAPLEMRLRNRPAPHNSVTTLRQVRDFAAARGVSPRVPSWPDFPRGDMPESLTRSGTPAAGAAVGFGSPDGAPWPDYRAEFQYVPEQHRYVRSIGGVPHVDGATGTQLGAETVVIQVAPVVVTDIVEDVLGSLSLDYQMEGQGVAYFLRDGLRWQGCWKRAGAFEPTLFFGPDGRLFPFGAGQVWIAVASPSTPIRWVGA